MANSENLKKSVLVTGGAGYVGSVLVPKLLSDGYNVKVLDLFIYGDHVLDSVKDHPCLKQVKGDIRDRGLLYKEIPGIDIIIHLACISNDPSYELNPHLGKAINYDGFVLLVDTAIVCEVKQFIYASSSSVYGLKEEPEVTEDHEREPLTDYSKYKALCEDYLFDAASDDFTVTTIRPATVCGYSPRLRLDLTVNILTNHAINKGKITVFGGEQKRPNLHIEDMTDLYCFLLKQPREKIHKEIFNVGYQNHTVMNIAKMVQSVIGKDIPINIRSTNDNRSYHVCSEKIKNKLGFEPKHTIEEAIADLKKAFETDKIVDPLNNSMYYNIKMMRTLGLE